MGLIFKNKPMSVSKSLSKRVRITRNGKVVRRPMAVDHFRTRASQKNIRNKRKMRSLGLPMKTLLKY